MFLRSFEEFSSRTEILHRGDKILVSVSGGLDSMVLLDVFCELRGKWQLELSVAHFNHQLRGEESDRDEAFVRAQSAERGLICYVERSDTSLDAEAKKLSIQEAARNARYNFLDKLRRSLSFDRIATGHHMDDNAETMLLNFIRGAGVSGLTGIPVERKDLAVIRPLLFASRDEIRSYSGERSLAYREDSTNARTEYTRNFIRHGLIPLIRDNVNPNLSRTLARMSGLFHELEKYLQRETRALRESSVRCTASEVAIGIPALTSAPLFLQEYLLHEVGREFCPGAMDSSAVRTMIAMAGAETGSWSSLGQGAVVCRDRDRLILRQESRRAPYRYPIEIGRTYEFEGYGFLTTRTHEALFSANPNVEYADAGRLTGGELALRPWSEGDWFIPLGMGERKKLSDFFIDLKVPAFAKLEIPILVSGEDIVWVCGRRLDERYKITPHTREVLRMEYRPRTQKVP